MPSISNLLNRQEPTGSIPRERAPNPDVLAINDDRADQVFDALSSDTARNIIAALYEEPKTASQLARQAETSIQNVKYHIDKLTEVGLVKIVGTRYSEQGTEMKVYAPTNDALVLFAGSEVERTTITGILKQTLTFAAGFAVVALILDWVVRGQGSVSGSVPLTGSATLTEPQFALPPGGFFFLGVLLTLLVTGFWRYRRSL